MRTALVAIALALVLVAGCATTHIEDSWRNPEVGQIDFRRVVAIGLTDDATLRRKVEDTLARLGGRAQIVPSHEFLSEAQLRDVEQAKAAVRERGFDGAVVFRVVDTETRQTYVPGAYASPYYSLWGYYGYVHPTVFDPGYVITDKVVEVETLLYRVSDAKLVWGGRSETLNPGSVQDLVQEVAAAVSDALREEGLVE